MTEKEGSEKEEDKCESCFYYKDISLDIICGTCQPPEYEEYKDKRKINHEHKE